MFNSLQDDPNHGPDDVQTQMEQSIQRAVTLVFWYKPQTEPIRLHYSIPTFPLFQLSHLPALTADLGLSPTSYVDVYVPHTGHWKQNLLTTVRAVERDQRLLYRTRKSLLDGLAEHDCLGLADELRLQPAPSPKPPADVPPGAHGALKRPAPDTPASPHEHKVYLVDASQADPTARDPQHPHPPSPAGPPRPPPSARASPAPAPHTAPPTPLPFRLTPPKSPTAPIPYHPHPPLKRWPNDYTVSELGAGFRALDVLAAHAPPVPQRAAFERVFGCRYVKSTVCRHRGVWRRADGALRAAYEAMGADERAVWGEFVRRVEGRPPGKIGQGQGLGAGEQPVATAADAQAGEVDEADGVGAEVALQEPAGLEPSGHMNVYDPALGGGVQREA